MKKLLVSSAIAMALASTSAIADIEISGFASITGGKVLSGDGTPQFGNDDPTFLADYPLVSAYTDEWAFDQESLFGLQFSSDLSEGLSVTAQLVGRGANEWKPEFEWAYVSYELNENWTLQAGKKRLPLFYYSDFYDVGYAYTWIRPPADTYTWQMFNYNGVNALYNDEWAGWSVSGNLYTGSEDSKDNKLLGEYFFNAETREVWKDIYGGVFSATQDWFEVRVTHMQYTNEREINGETVEWNGSSQRDGKFYGLSMNFDFDSYFILTELNKVELGDEEFDSYMVSAGYRIGEFTPFVSYSDFEGSGIEDPEAHNTTSAGVRYDFHDSAALKVQYDIVKDNSFENAVSGDAKALSVSIDLVF